MLNKSSTSSIAEAFFCSGGVGGSRKSYVILMGGSCQMLTIDDKGGGRGVKNPKNLLT